MHSSSTVESVLRMHVHNVAANAGCMYQAACSPDEQYVAAAFGNGDIHILHGATMQTLVIQNSSLPHTDLPCTCVRWFPMRCDREASFRDNLADKDESNSQKRGTSNDSTAYDIVSATSTGTVVRWEWNGTSLSFLAMANETNNEIMCVEVAPSGNIILTAGSDRIIRVYSHDLQPIKQLSKYYNASRNSFATAHLNRIFSLRCRSDYLVISAGWQGAAYMWDLRTGYAETQYQGVRCASDGVEPARSSRLCVFASARSKPSLRVFDCTTGIESIEHSNKLAVNIMPNECAMLTRVDVTSGLIWILCADPHALIVLEFMTGNFVARMSLPKVPFNMNVRTDKSALIACSDGVLIEARVCV